MTTPTTSLERSPASRERLALAIWLAIAAIQVASSFALRGDGGSTDDQPIFEYSLGIGSLFIYGVLVAVTWATGRLYVEPKDALGMRSFAGRYLGYAALVVIASLIVAAALEPVLNAGEEQGLAPQEWESGKLAPFLFNALVIVTVVPFAEELFFRGLGVTVLSAFGPVVAVVGTSLVFGLAHGILVALPPLVFFALGLAWVRLRAQSAWPGIIAHSAYNAIGLAAAALTAA